jgi:hypothetical protein
MLHAPFLTFVVLLIKYTALLIVMESFCNNIQSLVTSTFILSMGLLQVVIMLVIDKENDRALFPALTGDGFLCLCNIIGDTCGQEGA